MKKAVILLGALVCLLSSEVVLAAAPTQQLTKSIEELRSLVWTSDSSDYSKKLERRNQIFKVIENCFDLTEMSRRSLGEYYDQLSVQQQTEFDLAFSRLLEEAYVRNLDRYRSSRMEIVSERPFGGKYYYVATALTEGRRTTAIHYYLHQVGGQWLVYDVHINGVSLVGDYRNKFRKAIREKHLEGLMSMLKKQLQQLEDG